MAFRQCLRVLKKRGITSVMIGAGMFTSHEEKHEGVKPEDKLKFQSFDLTTLSYDYMIKQSTVDSVNSASQNLTVTYAAIESTSNEYREILSSLMHLIEDTLLYEVSDDHNDAIVVLRSELESKKKILNQLIGYMESVQRMAESVTTLAYLSGLDNLSVTLCERMDDALRQRDSQVRENKKLEEEYFALQDKVVKQSEAGKTLEEPEEVNLPSNDV